MRRVVLLVAALGAMAMAGFAAADEPVPIGEVVADPDAYHFRLIALQGTVRQVTPLPPYAPGPDTACYGAYTFVLEDGTGSMEINVLGICGKPVLRKPEVGEGETILLVAQILSPNRVTSASKGEVKRLRAVANTITHLSPAAPQADQPAPGRTEEAAAPEGEGKPEKDGGY
jgi:hypothetical protein